MNTALKRAIDELYTLADPNGASVSGAVASTSTEREQLKTEFIDFMSYLSSSDGTISESEAQFISEYFGQGFTPEELKTYVEKNGTYSTAFEKKAPKTLERFVAQDNALFKQRLELASSASASYIDVFDCLGKEFLVCDGDADKQEITLVLFQCINISLIFDLTYCTLGSFIPLQFDYHSRSIG